MTFSREAVDREAINVTCRVDVKWSWIDPRTASEHLVPGWHISLTAEDRGQLFRRCIVITPTNPLAILGGLTGPILTTKAEEEMLRLARKAEGSIRTDIAFWRLMQKEKQ